MKRKLLSLLLVSAMTLSVLGCGNETADTEVAGSETDAAISTEAAEELEYVELDWYLNIGDMPDKAMIQEALDEYFLEKLNCKVTMVSMGNAEYTELMPTKLLAGDKVDIFFAPSSMDFGALARADALYPLDELLDTYGQDTKALFKPEVWNAVKKEGHIYAIPTLKDNANIIGFTYNADMASALGIDFESTEFSTFFETEDFFMDALAKRDEVFPEYKGKPLIGDQRTNFVPFFFKLERLISGNVIAVSNIKGYEADPTKGPHEVYNFYETDAFREYCHMLWRWVQNGIMANSSDGTNYYSDPCILTRSGWGYTYVDEHLYSKDFVTKLKILEGVWTDASVFSSGTAIGAGCKDPERAMMVINLLNTDPYIATMLRFGLEGVHWERDAEGKLQMSGRNAESPRGWYYWYGPSFGNLTIVEAPERLTGSDNQLLTVMAECNNNAILGTHMGCVVDTTNIQNEIAACNNVIAEYAYLLKGSLETPEAIDNALDAFIAKLKANGSERIVAEIQAQVDAWVAAQ